LDFHYRRCSFIRGGTQHRSFNGGTMMSGHKAAIAELKDSIRILRMELEQKEQALEAMMREYEVHAAKQNLNKIYDMVQGVWIEGQR
jgi:glutamate mutase epsilon subunit